MSADRIAAKPSVDSSSFESASMAPNLSRPNWLEVDLEAIASNALVLRSVVGANVKLFAALKSNAYGFGLVAVASTLEAAGINGLAVVDPRSAVSIRRHGIRLPILLYGGTLPTRPLVEAINAFDLMPTIMDARSAQIYSELARGTIEAWIKVDVGLERLGARPDEATALGETIDRLPDLELCGVYTHLDVPAARDVASYLEWQFQRFNKVLRELEERKIHVPTAMAASSAVLQHTLEMNLNGVDPGHLFFGIYPPGPHTIDLALMPALRAVRSQVVHIKSIDRTLLKEFSPFPMREGMRIGVLPIGRSDGMDSITCGQVLVRGCRVPIVGEFSAEHTRIDLTDVPEARLGDEATIIGSQAGNEISVAEVVQYQRIKRISTLAVAVRQSVPRVYFGQNGEMITADEET